MSDQKQNLSKQTKNTPDNLSDGEKLEAKWSVEQDYASSQP